MLQIIVWIPHFNSTPGDSNTPDTELLLQDGHSEDGIITETLVGGII